MLRSFLKHNDLQIVVRRMTSYSDLDILVYLVSTKDERDIAVQTETSIKFIQTQTHSLKAMDALLHFVTHLAQLDSDIFFHTNREYIANIKPFNPIVEIPFLKCIEPNLISDLETCGEYRI